MNKKKSDRTARDFGWSVDLVDPIIAFTRSSLFSHDVYDSYKHLAALDTNVTSALQIQFIAIYNTEDDNFDKSALSLAPRSSREQFSNEKQEDSRDSIEGNGVLLKLG